MQRPIAFETFLFSATASSDFGTIFATVGFKTLEDLLLWYSLPSSCFRLSIAFAVHPSFMFQFEQHHWLHVPKVMGFHLCRDSIYLTIPVIPQSCVSSYDFRSRYPNISYITCFSHVFFNQHWQWLFHGFSSRKIPENSAARRSS